MQELVREVHAASTSARASMMRYNKSSSDTTQYRIIVKQGDKHTCPASAEQFHSLPPLIVALTRNSPTLNFPRVLSAETEDNPIHTSCN